MQHRNTIELSACDALSFTRPIPGTFSTESFSRKLSCSERSSKINCPIENTPKKLSKIYHNTNEETINRAYHSVYVHSNKFLPECENERLQRCRLARLWLSVHYSKALMQCPGTPWKKVSKRCLSVPYWSRIC